MDFWTIVQSTSAVLGIAMDGSKLVKTSVQAVHHFSPSIRIERLQSQQEEIDKLVSKLKEDDWAGEDPEFTREFHGLIKRAKM